MRIRSLILPPPRPRSPGMGASAAIGVKKAIKARWTQHSYKVPIHLPKVSIQDDEMSRSAYYHHLDARINPMAAEIYTVKATASPGAYTFTKFDNDLNPLKVYLVASGECNCPRGETGKRCRHQDMLPTFLKAKHIGDGWLFNLSTKQWLAPPTAAAELIDEREANERTKDMTEEKIENLLLGFSDPAPEPQILASAPQPPVSSGAGSTPLGPSFKRKI